MSEAAGYVVLVLFFLDSPCAQGLPLIPTAIAVPAPGNWSFLSPWSLDPILNIDFLPSSFNGFDCLALLPFFPFSLLYAK